MKFLISIFKMLQILFLMSVPFVITYWLILQVDLPALNNLKVLCGQVLDPAILFISSFGSFKNTIDGYTVDYRALILAGVLIGMSVISNSLEKSVRFISRSIDVAMERRRKKALDMARQKAREKYLKKLKMHKIIYLTIDFQKSESSMLYLLDQDKNAALTSESDRLIAEMIYYSTKFNCKKTEQHLSNAILCQFTFFSPEEVIDYLLYIHNKIKKINPELMNIGEKISFYSVLHCAVDKNTFILDMKLIEKLLRLAGENEICVTEIFKNKCEVIQKHRGFRFFTKGVYNIFDQKYDIFQLKL